MYRPPRSIFESFRQCFRGLGVGGILASAAFSAQADETANLDLTIGDIFPAVYSDRRAAGRPRALVLAQTTTGADAKRDWQSALPPADKFDWLQTKSGEWLKGTLKVLYSGNLEFDSDEFGLQVVDWDNVAQIRGHGTKRVSIETPDGPITIDGNVTVTNDKIIIESEGATREFDRSQIISITPGASTEWDNWSLKVGLGINFSRGNTDQTEYTAKINIKRRTPENRFVIDYLGNFAKSGDDQTANNHRFNTYFDIFAAKNYFWRPVFAEYYRDPFQNIDYRATIGAGGGYTIIDTPVTTWNVTGGPAYRSTGYVSVQPGDSQQVSTPALVVGTAYETSLTKTVDFNGSYNVSIVNESSGTFTHHAIATFETALTEILDFDISFVWDRTQNPQARSDGTVPKKDDYQLLLTLGVDI